MSQGYGGFGGEYITDEVKKFISQFRISVESGSPQLIWQSYRHFRAITKNTFKVSSWPSVNGVMKVLNLTWAKHETFFLLYSELYYRHIFDRCEIERQHMWDAFQNYINLFNKMLEPTSNFPTIPDPWLWKMVNSFVSQFQYYQHWKNNATNIDFLLERQGTNEQENIQEKWTVQAVLRYLHALVNAGGIDLQYNPPADESLQSKTLKMLGFFSLIGLLRVHCLLNDYRTAVKVLDKIDLRKKSAISKIEDCHITAHYYLALSYLMTKRWVDCHNVCVSVVSRYQNLLKTDDLRNIDAKVAKAKREDPDLTDKDIYHESYLKGESMLLRCYALLAITHFLNNKTQRLDKTLYEQMNDMLSDEMDDLSSEFDTLRNDRDKGKNDDKKSKDDEKQNSKSKNSDNNNSSSFQRKRDAFERLFLLGCPDYPNTFDLFVDTEAAMIDSSELKKNQFSKFFRLVNLNKSYEISRMRDELKLYQAIPASKLAKQLEFGDSNTFEKELIQLKSNMRQLKRVDGISSNGEWSTQSDFDFFIKKDDVNVRRVDGSRLGRYTDMFVKNIREVKDLIDGNR